MDSIDITLLIVLSSVFGLVCIGDKLLKDDCDDKN